MTAPVIPSCPFYERIVTWAVSPWSTPDDRLPLCRSCRYWRATNGPLCSQCAGER